MRKTAEEELIRIGAPCIADAVRNLLRAALARGDEPPPSSVAVARSLGLSERSLRRKLSESHTSFREILDQVRRESARKLLDQHGRSISEIAFAAGSLRTA